MPLTAKGQKILAAMRSQYGTKRGESVFYASRNKGKISGVDRFLDAARKFAQDKQASAAKSLFEIKDQTSEILTFAAPRVASLAPAAAGKLLPAGNAMSEASRWTSLNPLSATPTASQAQENQVMGRPSSAGPFGQTDVKQFAFGHMRDCAQRGMSTRDAIANWAKVCDKRIGHRTKASDDDPPASSAPAPIKPLATEYTPTGGGTPAGSGTSSTGWTLSPSTKFPNKYGSYDVR